jgi:hypothetical protein
MEGVAVELGVDGHGGHPELPTGADNPDSDLTTVGDQDLLEHALSFDWPGLDTGGCAKVQH